MNRSIFSVASVSVLTLSLFLSARSFSAPAPQSKPVVIPAENTQAPAVVQTLKTNENSKLNSFRLKISGFTSFSEYAQFKEKFLGLLPEDSFLIERQFQARSVILAAQSSLEVFDFKQRLEQVPLGKGAMVVNQVKDGFEAEIK